MCVEVEHSHEQVQSLQKDKKDFQWLHLMQSLLAPGLCLSFVMGAEQVVVLLYTCIFCCRETGRIGGGALLVSKYSEDKNALPAVWDSLATCSGARTVKLLWSASP